MNHLPCDHHRCTGVWNGGQCECREQCLRYVDIGERCRRMPIRPGAADCESFVPVEEDI